MEETMKGLEGAREWLRPLVQTKAWDYCVVWKLGDDPSRFIEWMGCCCSGGGHGQANIKEEQDMEHPSTPLCRDAQFEHPIRTKACESLAQLPSSMPLYSGFHGEAVLSTQPRWKFSNANASESEASNDSIGTQVLIPVAGGLIELFAAKHIPKDEKIIEVIAAQCTIPFDQEAMSAWSCTTMDLNEHHLEPLPEESLHNRPSSLQLSSFRPRIQVLPPLIQSSFYSSVEGSSNGSNPWHQCPPLDLDSCHMSLLGSLKQSIGKSSRSSKSKNTECSLKQQTGSVSNCDNAAENDKAKVIPKPQGEQYHSKNLVTERKRRRRIKDGLYTLRSLVPRITKMDMSSILGDAIGYIQELQKEGEQLQDQLTKMEEEDCKKNKAESKISTSDSIHGDSISLLLPEQNQGSSGCGEKKQTEVQVEVNQISQRDFWIRFCCEQRRGGFTRLMEALNLLGLQVADANITTFRGKVLNILKVEAKKDIQLTNLRSSLIELAN